MLKLPRGIRGGLLAVFLGASLCTPRAASAREESRLIRPMAAPHATAATSPTARDRSALDRARAEQRILAAKMIAEMERVSGMSFAELCKVQCNHLCEQAKNATPKGKEKLSLGAFFQAVSAANAMPPGTTSRWASLDAKERAAWERRFSTVVERVLAEAPPEIVDIVRRGSDVAIRFDEAAVEARAADILALSDGDFLVVGTRWVKAAEKDPKDVRDNIAHELLGHACYGDPVSWRLIHAAIDGLPKDDVVAARSSKSTFDSFAYPETEVYAELIELPYRSTASAGDDPAKDVEKLLCQIRRVYAPSVANALVRGFRCRIYHDERVKPVARDLYDRLAEKVFGIAAW